MNVEGARQLFPKELEDLLTFKEKEDAIIIKPKNWLAGDRFAKVAAIVKDKGGEWVSAGKESHFKLPRTSEKKAESATVPCPHCGKHLVVEIR